jgi:hypothetical protein
VKKDLPGIITGVPELHVTEKYLAGNAGGNGEKGVG